MVNKNALLYVLMALLTVWGVVCFNPFLLWFQNDDFSHILLSKQGVMFQRNSFRPVCDLSIMLDYYIWQQYAPGYHITNLVLHCTCSVLVYFFSKKMLLQYISPTTSRISACLAAILFFIYPFHGEAVFWVLGRSGILGAIFSLSFLLLFLRGRHTVFGNVMATGVYLAALLTYEQSWVLLLVAFVLEKRPRGQKFSAKIKRYYVPAAIFCIYLAARYMVIKQVVGSYEGVNFLQFNGVTLLQNFFKLAAMGFTAWRDSPKVLQVFFLISLIISLHAFAKRTRNGAIALLVCFFACLLPCLSLGIDTHGTEGERFLYLPSVFMVLLVTVGVDSFTNNYIKWLAAAGISILYGLQLYVTAVNYRFAGAVVKQTVTQITAAPAGASIVIKGLPKSQHGALILANGLEDVQGLYLPGKQPAVTILSWRNELNPLLQPYKTTVLNSPGGASDIKMVFNDSALVIYK